MIFPTNLLFSTEDAKVVEPEITEGVIEAKEPAPAVSDDPAVVPHSAVNADLADRVPPQAFRCERFSDPEVVRNNETLLKFCMEEGKHA